MKKIISGFVLLFACVTTKAQDINFSQFYELPLLRNPALSGLYNGDMRLTSAFRSQWGSVTVPYNTMAMGAELKYPLGGENNYDFINFGVQVTQDIAGDSKFSKSQFLPVLTINKSLNDDKDSYLSMGFMAGIAQQRFDPSQLHFSDQFVGGSYRPSNPTHQTFNRSNLIYCDATVGLSYNSVTASDVRYYIGLGYFHFTKPKVAFNPANDIRLNQKYVLNAGASANAGEYNRFILYADYFRQGGASQGQGGFLLSHEVYNPNEEKKIFISGGLCYRWNDAIIPLLKLEYNMFAMGMSYDANISKLKPASRSMGGFELTLSYISFYKSKQSSKDKYRCPRGINRSF